MKQIYLSDTVEQFIKKCNDNFDEIKNYGGPQGRPGRDGRVGATGKRGSSIRYVEVDNGDSDFTISDADEAVHNLELDAGDVVIFSNGYFGNIDIDEEGSEYVPVVSSISGSLIGPPGPQGPTGDPATEQFDVINGMTLHLRNQYSGLSISRNDSSQAQRELMVDNIRFRYGGQPVGSIISTPTEVGLNSNLTISISSNNILVGGDSTSDIKINGNGSVSIGSGANSLFVGGSEISVNGNSRFNDIVNFNGNVFFNGTTQTNVSGGSVSADNISVKKLVVNAGGTDNLVVDTNGMNFGNKFTLQGNVVRTNMRIDSESAIRVKKGNEFVILDTPKYSMTLWPDGSETPDNWVPLNMNIYITDVRRLQPQNQNISQTDGKLYFVFNGIKYVIDNINNQLYDTIIVPVNGGNANGSDVIDYIVNPSSRNLSGQASQDDQLSASINNAGSTDFVDRVFNESYYYDNDNVTTQTSIAFSGYSHINLDGDMSDAIRPDYTFRIGNTYGGFMSNLLNPKKSGGLLVPKDMSAVFTLITTTTNQTTHSFIFPKPQAPAGFMWIFKNA